MALPTPYQIAKQGSESAHQIAFFAYCRFAKNNGIEKASLWAQGKPFAHIKASPIPELAWIHSVPNGAMMGDDAKSRAIRGGRMKSEGLTDGVSDICWPMPLGGYHGIYIEMKKPELKPKKKDSKGGVSDEQKDFLNFISANGYFAAVCYSWEEACWTLNGYLELKNEHRESQ